MAESTDQRLERLMKETGSVSSDAPTSADDVEQALNEDMGYQMTTGPDRVLARKQAYEQHGLTPPTSISSPGTKELNESGPIHTYVRPALELGGMMAGGAAGAGLGAITPLTPVGGAMVGGTLGYAGGDTAASFLERMAGERPPIDSVQQALAETGRSLGTGGTLESVSRLVGKGVGAIGSKLLSPFARQYEGANKTLDEIAKAKGVTLDPHEVVQSRPLSLGHKVLENIPFTSGMIQRNEMKKLEGLTKEWERIRQSTGTDRRQLLGDVGQRIQDTVERNLDKIGMRQGDIRDQAREAILTQLGSPVSYKELGEQTQKAVTEHYQGLKELEQVAWNTAKAAIPADARVIPTSLPAAAKDVEKKYQNMPAYTDENLLGKLRDAQGSGNKLYDARLAKFNAEYPEALDPAKAGNLKIKEKLQADKDAAQAEALGGEKPGWKLDDLMTMRSELSSLAAEHHSGIQRGATQQGSSDTYGKIFNDLKSAIDQDVEAFAGAQSSDVADLFHAARAATGMRKSLFNPKEHPGIARALKADPATIANALIKPGSSAGFAELKNMVGPQASDPVKQAFTNQLLGVGGKEADGLPGLRRKLDQYGLQTMQDVYSPQEIKDLYHLADQSTWMAKSPVGNPFFRQLVKTSIDKVAPTILGHPELTAKVLRQFPNTRADLRTAFVGSLKPKEAMPFPTQMLQNLNAYPPEVQKQLFSQAEIRDFYDLARVVERTRGTVKLAENPSGTAQNLVTFATGGAVLKHPIKMIPTILGATSVAKLYLSKVGRRFLLEGLMSPANAEHATRNAYITSQILGVAGIDEAADLQDQERRRRGLIRGLPPQLEQGAP
jgi:hypothetical protein